MQRELVKVEPPEIDEHWFVDTAWEIVAGGDKELEALLKLYAK